MTGVLVIVKNKIYNEYEKNLFHIQLNVVYSFVNINLQFMSSFVAVIPIFPDNAQTIFRYQILVEHPPEIKLDPNGNFDNYIFVITVACMCYNMYLL